MSSQKRPLPNPPNWVHAFFRWYCHPDYLEDLEGDLNERFEKNLEEIGPQKAKWRYFFDVLQLFRPGIIRSIEGNYHLNYYGMFKTFLKSGWRSFVKYKVNSLINVFGLSMGIAATLLLYLIIDFEQSYDKFHSESEHIYRLADKRPDGNISSLVVTPLLPNLKKDYPEIVAGTRFYDSEDIFTSGEEGIHLYFGVVDPDFSSIFSFQTIHGDLEYALSQPGKITITQEVSQKLFGYQNPVGEVLQMKEMEMDLVIEAVVKNPPANSTLQFDALVSWPSSPNHLDEDQMGNWYNTFMTAYVKLSPNASAQTLEEKTAAFTDKYYLEGRKSNLVSFLPLEEEHSRISQNDSTTKVLGIIAIAILLISCINFINLSISQWLTRTREIGMRKVLGSYKSQLVFQFLVEGFFTTGVSVIIAMLMVYSILPSVNDYYNLGIRLEITNNLSSILLLVLVCFSVGMISSITTALVMANVQTIKSLKEKIKWSGSGQWLQKGLIIFQFGISLVFIAGTMVIWQQIDYMKSYDLKFKGDHIVSVFTYAGYFKDPEKTEQNLLRLRENLPNDAAIEAVTLSENVPGKYWDNYNWFENLDSNGVDGLSLKQINIDHNYFDLLDINILHGRGFSDSIKSDENALIINEKAMKIYGWTDLENKYLKPGGWGENTNGWPVIGVVEDYHYRSLKQSVEPLVHFYSPNSTNRLLVKLHPEKYQEGIQLLEEAWQDLGAYQPFSYAFVDEDFNQLYKTQERLGMTSMTFSGIAVIIALLGLFSISTFMMKQRKKEIGVRKVLGATMFNIIILVSKGFLFLIGIAFFISIPLIYWLSKEFLAEFTYQMELTPAIFMLSGSILFLLALLVISWQSLNVASNNPVNSLTDE
ncbi:ABC transporter permease [Flexithrix dorotheae]|uniref:ABC transporter permease n=1 Tax=Flexithrix dorotheae TaxID=70993 RepID=UPI00035FCFAA|nr:ABC transporter permease [Flexithrix dorotheae]